MNKIRISKFQEEKLLQKLREYKYDRSNMIKHYAKYKLDGCLFENSSTGDFLSIFENLDLQELVLVISGFYEVYLSEEDIVLQKYKENKKIAKTSQLISNRNEAIGFIKAIDFINIIYKLNIDLEDN